MMNPAVRGFHQLKTRLRKIAIKTNIIKDSFKLSFVTGLRFALSAEPTTIIRINAAIIKESITAIVQRLISGFLSGIICLFEIESLLAKKTNLRILRFLY